jgi:integrase
MGKRSPHYSLYKKPIGKNLYWYVRYWDPYQKRYTAHRSTGVEVAGKKGRRAEAEAEAIRMLPIICFNCSRVSMLEYLTSFWRPDSPYFREYEKVHGRKLSAYYPKTHLDVIRLHVAPYPGFQAIGLEKLTPRMIRDWMLWLAERGVSGTRINRAMQAIRVPLRYALSREEVYRDPFTLIKPAHETRTEKGILTQKEVTALIASPARDKCRRLAVLLGVLCGMRLGEVRGLHWDDLDPEAGIIHIRHNWQDMEGIKAPKCGSERDVPLPLAVKQAGESYQGGKSVRPGELIFGRKDGKPLCNGYFRLALIAELAAAGINKVIVQENGKTTMDDSVQRRRNITFHSLRHTYITLNRILGVSDFEIQALAGHKSFAMTERYSHAKQVVDIESARKRIDLLSPRKPPELAER